MIDSLDVLFLFLNQRVKEMRKELIRCNTKRICDTDDPLEESNKLVNLIGSKLDGFLRQVLVHSGQMMFEHICELFFAYMNYLQERPYQHIHSTQLLE